MAKVPHDRQSGIFNLDKFLAYYTERPIVTTEGLMTPPLTHTRSPIQKSLLPLPLSLKIATSTANVLSPILSSALSAETPQPACEQNDHARRYFNAMSEGRWVDSIFSGQGISFGPKESRYVWNLGENISENVHFSSQQSYASAIFECSQTQGRVQGPKAWMKIYVQIPYYDETLKQICTKPSRVPQWITNEIAALKRLSQVKSHVVIPRLLAIKRKAQTDDMWVPGGFMTCIVIQQLPGTIMSTNIFWSLPTTSQDIIRKSFRESLERLWQLGVMPRNCSIEKLVWDTGTETCHIVDLEGAEVINHTLRWWDYEYFRWGLSKIAFRLGESSPLLPNLSPSKIQYSTATSR